MHSQTQKHHRVSHHNSAVRHPLCSQQSGWTVSRVVDVLELQENVESLGKLLKGGILTLLPCLHTAREQMLSLSRPCQ